MGGLFILGWPQASRGLLLRQRVFFFHQNFTATVPKFRTFQFYIQEVLLFSPEFYRDRTKIQDMQECVSFSPEFYRNRTKIQDFSISHTGGVSFFTRILPRPYQN